ncbi:MAG: GNAT family protein [Bacteroidota bacterium]
MLNQHHRLKDGRSIFLRQASPLDAAALLVAIEQIIRSSTYTLTTPAELDRSVEDQGRRIQQYTEARGGLILVATSEEQIVGTLDFMGHHKLRNQHCGEFGMGIIPDFRGQGLGKVLLTALLEWATQHPIIEKVCLGVFADHAVARQLYRKAGFVEEGVHRGAIKLSADHYADEVRMCRWVKSKWQGQEKE